MTSDVKEAGVAHSRRMVWRIFGMALSCGIAIGLFIWGVLAMIFYVDGLFNSQIALALGPVLLPAVFVGGFLLPIWLVLKVPRHCGLDTRAMRRGVIVLMIGSGLASWFGLGLTRLVPDPLSTFARGVARYVEHRADIVAAQDWLSMLDPNDCEDQRLGREVASGADIRNPRKYVPVPPALGGLARYSIALSKDNDGRPMVRARLGGSRMMGSWGIVVGFKDMPVPPSGDSELMERRYPLGPGAYIWFQE